MARVRIGINGLGRIGRTVLRLASLRARDRTWPGRTRPMVGPSGAAAGDGVELEVVAANDLLSPAQLAYLLEYDSVQGTGGPVELRGERLRLDGLDLQLYAHRDPGAIPWAEAGVDVVLECTGAFGRRRELERHLGGAPRVVLGAPGEADVMVVLGANEAALDPTRHRLVSAASCTTHALAPVLAVLDRSFGIRWAVVGTVHAYTAGQALIDGASAGSDLRRGRAAAVNIVPTTTHAGRALTQVLPALAGKVSAAAVRVPVPAGSMWDLTCTLDGGPDLDVVLHTLREASSSPALRGILEVTDAPLVSSDIVGRTVSTLVDRGASYAAGPLLRLQGWYDNETGYAARLLDLAALFAGGITHEASDTP